MAKISVVQNSDWQLDLVQFNFSALLSGGTYSGDKHGFSIDKGEAGKVVFAGNKLTYDDGLPVEGLVKSFGASLGEGDGRSGFKVQGIKVEFGQILDAAGSESLDDDQALLAAMLRKNDQIRGGNGADKLAGFDGDDQIRGGGGDDIILGGAGRDKLSGGEGADAFVFDTELDAKRNVDKIADFDAAEDTIELSSAVFEALGAPGTLAPDLFKAIGKKGMTADADDRILFDIKTGNLFYDADGSGEDHARVKFAQLDHHAAVSAADFIVV